MASISLCTRVRLLADGRAKQKQHDVRTVAVFLFVCIDERSRARIRNRYTEMKIYTPWHFGWQCGASAATAVAFIVRFDSVRRIHQLLLAVALCACIGAHARHTHTHPLPRVCA